MSKSILNVDWGHQPEKRYSSVCKGKIRVDHEGKNPEFPRNGTEGNVE